MKQGVFVFLVFIVYLFSLIGGTGCANIVPPSGGPRDSLPPVMVRAEPADSTTNFKGEVIRLHFDEYIDLQNVSQNLLFTPLMETTPMVEVKLRTITIKLRDPLEENTTYTFNFGNSIRDYTEGNIIKDFTYTFSTGPALDSLELRGSVVMAETGKTDTTLQVLLHRNLADTAVQKELPRYAAKLDGRGNFHFKNLAPGTYAIYALGDAGAGRRYLDPKRQTFAFADAPVQVGDSSQNIVLYAYKEVSTTQTPTPAPAAPPRAPRGTTPNDRRLRFGTNLVGGNQQELTKDLVVTFDVPYRFLDTTKIALSTDSSFIPVPFTSTTDTLNKNLIIKTAWRENTQYNLVLDKDFAEDTTGKRLLKTDTLSFRTKRKADYGVVNIRLRNLENAEIAVLQFIQSGKVVLAVPIGSGVYRNDMFSPGDYELRILYDRNGNGVWDPGQFFDAKRQPELTQPIDRRITVKPAWDNEFEINL